VTVFEDSPEPFDPNDNLPKPEIGAWLTLCVPLATDLCLSAGRVTRTRDSLAEDWGSEGEAAWAMRDANEAAGFRGKWYAEIEDEDGIESEIVASYEVARIE